MSDPLSGIVWQTPWDQLPPLRWSAVESFDYWPKINSWRFAIDLNSPKRLQAVVDQWHDRPGMMALRRYWRRMVREGKMAPGRGQMSGRADLVTGREK